MSTTLENICFNDDDDDDVLFDVDEKEDITTIQPIVLEQRIMDFGTPHKQRRRYIEHLPVDARNNVIQRICSVYYISPLRAIEAVLLNLAEWTVLDYSIRIECADTIMNVRPQQGSEVLWRLIVNDEDAFNCFHYLIRLTYLYNITRNHPDNAEVKQYLYRVLCTDVTIPCPTRLSEITKLRKNNIDVTNNEWVSVYIQFIDHPANRHINVEQVIIACGNALVMSRDETVRTHIFTVLQTIATTLTYAENHRADAADMMVQHGIGQIQAEGNFIITLLGRNGNKRTVYEDKQNVHERSVQASVRNCIERLSLTQWDPTTSRSIDEYVEQYTSMAGENSDKVTQALHRITVDNSKFGKWSLLSIFHMVCCYIDQSEHKEELELRMLQELTDTAGMCNTGYSSRLVNVLSGFDDAYTVRIGWQEQITANVVARLNALLRDHPDCDTILEQMTNKHAADRCQYTAFMRQNMSRLRESLYSEFKDYITDDEWDVYFRNAIVHYEQ